MNWRKGNLSLHCLNDATKTWMKHWTKNWKQNFTSSFNGHPLKSMVKKNQRVKFKKKIDECVKKKYSEIKFLFMHFILREIKLFENIKMIYKINAQTPKVSCKDQNLSDRCRIIYKKEVKNTKVLCIKIPCTLYRDSLSCGSMLAVYGQLGEVVWGLTLVARACWQQCQRRPASQKIDSGRTCCT